MPPASCPRRHPGPSSFWRQAHRNPPDIHTACWRRLALLAAVKQLFGARLGQGTEIEGAPRHYQRGRAAVRHRLDQRYSGGSQRGGTVPPQGPGGFYPYWSLVQAGNSCVFLFGNVSAGPPSARTHSTGRTSSARTVTRSSSASLTTTPAGGQAAGQGTGPQLRLGARSLCVLTPPEGNGTGGAGRRPP